MEIAASFRVLLKTIRSAVPKSSRGMFDDIGDLFGEEELKKNLLWGEISLPDLAKLENEIDRAIQDEKKWAELWKGIGALVVGLAKGFLLALLLCGTLVTSGCGASPTPKILEAHRIQGRAIDALSINHAALMKFLTDSLLESWDTVLDRYTQYELILRALADSETEQRLALQQALDATQDLAAKERIQKIIEALPTSAVRLGHLQRIITEAKAAREKFKDTIDRIRGYDAAFSTNYTIAIRLHEKMRQFIARETYTLDDASSLVEDLNSAASGLVWTKTDDNPGH